MATLLTQGTLLEAKKIKKPLTKSFFYSALPFFSLFVPTFFSAKPWRFWPSPCI